VKLLRHLCTGDRTREREGLLKKGEKGGFSFSLLWAHEPGRLRACQRRERKNGMRARRTGGTLAAVLHLAALGAPSIASAQEADAGDAIYLQNGSVVRGTLVDVSPNVQARIRLATGEITAVPWQTIDHIERPTEPKKAASPATSAPATQGAAAAPAPATPRPMVWVHLEGRDDAAMQEDTTGDKEWSTVCSAPCDKPLPAGYDYRVLAPGMKTSSAFTLHGETGSKAYVVIHGASRTGSVVGWVGVIVGAAMVLVALDASGGGSSQNLDWPLLGTGVAVAGGGLALLLINAKTTVSQAVAPSGTSAVLPDSLNRARNERMWKDVEPGQAGLPSAIGIPMLGGRF
jgi:hypothetical protein